MALLEMILKREGSNPNFQDPVVFNKTNGPPLHLACSLNLPDVVSLLLKYGASLTQVFEGGNPIEKAIRLQNREVLKVLWMEIEHGQACIQEQREEEEEES